MVLILICNLQQAICVTVLERKFYKIELILKIQLIYIDNIINIPLFHNDISLRNNIIPF